VEFREALQHRDSCTAAEAEAALLAAAGCSIQSLKQWQHGFKTQLQVLAAAAGLAIGAYP
jgi:hypothetical protein